MDLKKNIKVLRTGLLIMAGATMIPAALAASGSPLPRCSAAEKSFYLMRYATPSGTGTPPTVTLDLATVPASGTVTRRTIWTGLGAPPASTREIARAPNPEPLPSGASVAGAMGKDGYIYAMRAIEDDNDWDNSPAAGSGSGQGGGWRTHTRGYEMLRYGRDGVDNLGMVVGLGTYRTDPTNAATQVNGAPLGTTPESYFDNRLGPNFNAADIDPVTGIMYIASFQSGGYLNKVFRVDVTQTPPKYLSTLTLSSNIPGAQSGDIVIDSTGTWAYGIATTGSGTSAASNQYRFNINTGVVETLASSTYGPYGAGARLSNTSSEMVFTGRTGLISTGSKIMTIPTGALGSSQPTTFTSGGDAASCLPKLTATLACTPSELVDSAGNVANCTVTLDQPAPVGGMTIAITPPVANPRYSTTCGNTVVVEAGQTSATCSITATPNIAPEDGDVTAAIALAEPAALDDYVLGASTAAEVIVRNDDVAEMPVVNLACTPNMLLDSSGQESTCTVTLNSPAPVGGISVDLTPPAGNERYTSNCMSPAIIAAGSTESICTITAKPNTVVGDGSVTAVVQLLAGSGYSLGGNSQASVVVDDDDLPANQGGVKPVPTLGQWALALMTMLIVAMGLIRIRRNHN